MTELGDIWPVNLACDSDFHVNCRDLLHATNLRHWTDGFTSPLMEGTLWIFRPKYPTASVGFENPLQICEKYNSVLLDLDFTNVLLREMTTMQQLHTQEIIWGGYARKCFRLGWGCFNKLSWGQRAERTGTWNQPISNWMKLAFWYGCYGSIFHGIGNSVRLCQNFGMSGGFESPKTTNPRYATAMHLTMIHLIMFRV
jgi:hypothetical protein